MLIPIAQLLFFDGSCIQTVLLHLAVKWNATGVTFAIANLKAIALPELIGLKITLNFFDAFDL